MLILCYTTVPLFRNANVYTAYEYLERRFDARVRALISGIFLLQRGMALGVTLYAPAVVLTVILGWPDWVTTLLMGGLAVSYTTAGGAKAIAWSDLQQMIVMTLGLVTACIAAVLLLPDHVSLGGAVHLAAVAGRLNVVTTTFDWNDRYNLWSGLIGGTFLALAYFGTDQSQVQRYLSGESIRETRRGLLLNAVAKIPMQLGILFIGVMVFVFHIYTQPPMLFQRLEQSRIERADVRDRFDPLSQRYQQAFDQRRSAADALLALNGSANAAVETRQTSEDTFRRAQADLDKTRRDAAALAQSAGGSGASDTNYIFLSFVTQFLPVGVVGLVLAVVFGATMTAVSAEMSSLATVSIVDVYKRHVQPAATDRHYLTASRLATLLWGAYAIVCANLIKGIGSLVEAVNVLGSLFYGSMLGVFVLAFFFKRVTSGGAFLGVVVGQLVVLACWKYTGLAFLWYNVLGCAVVVTTAVIVSALFPAASTAGHTRHAPR
jgi:Na+/proline symporter